MYMSLISIFISEGSHQEKQNTKTDNLPLFQKHHRIYKHSEIKQNTQDHLPVAKIHDSYLPGIVIMAQRMGKDEQLNIL